MSTGVGKRIRQRRKELGLSQEELAARMGFKSKQSVSNVEIGRDNLTTDRVTAFAKALDCSESYLMGWADDTKDIKNATFKERINDLMKMYAMKQADFCLRTGLDKSIVSLYVSGKREPAQDNIFIISRAFEIDPEWLMGYDVPMNNKLSPDNARLVGKIRNDAELLEALKVYFSLPEDKKKYAVNLIKMLGD